MVSNEIQFNALYDDTAARRHDEVSRERGRTYHCVMCLSVARKRWASTGVRGAQWGAVASPGADEKKELMS